MKQDNIENMRLAVVEQALPEVVYDGWEWSVIERAAIGAGYEKDTARAIFPAQMNSVMQSFGELADQRMMDNLKDVDPEGLKIRERVKLAVWTRFMTLEADKEAVRQSLSYLTSPFRQHIAGKILWRTADCIWDWAGDTATDYNRYTKRGLLSGILASTALVWINDDGDNHDKTSEFLDRRIENVLQIGKVMGKLKQRGKTERP